jgi:hypothetical protein
MSVCHFCVPPPSETKQRTATKTVLKEPTSYSGYHLALYPLFLVLKKKHTEWEYGLKSQNSVKLPRPGSLHGLRQTDFVPLLFLIPYKYATWPGFHLSLLLLFLKKHLSNRFYYDRTEIVLQCLPS